jgi:hypothetical protein
VKNKVRAALIAERIASIPPAPPAPGAPTLASQTEVGLVQMIWTMENDQRRKTRGPYKARAKAPYSPTGGWTQDAD